MQFILIGYDGKDDKALERRMAARTDHLTLGDQMIERGELVMATVLLNEDDQMMGSVMLVNFPSREDLDKWLETEPYITGDVWQKTKIFPAKLGPSFAHLLQG